MTSTVRVVRDWVGEPVRALVFYADAQGTGKSAESVLTEAVVDVPDAPGTFEATGGDEEVVLTWEIPADNGKPITGYAYRDSSVGATWSAWPETLPISADATRYPITTGLTNNTRYWFELRAHNDAGAGRVAAASATPKAALNISGETTPTVDEDSTRVAEYTTNAAAGTTVAWSLDGTDKTAFTITETEGTGRLSFQAAPDYENPTDVGGDTGDNAYHVEVIATAGSSADTLAVTVAVQNVEEAGSIELTSTQPQVDKPLTATLTDPDGCITGANWTWQRAADKTAPWKDITSSNPNTVASSVRTDSAEPYPEVSSYTPVAGDIGYLLRATVSYRDGQSEDDTDRKSAQSDTTEAVVDVPSAPGSLTASVQAQSPDGAVTYYLDGAVRLRWAQADSNGAMISAYQVAASA